MIIAVILSLCGAMLLGALYMLARNQWVYRQQMKFHSEAFERPTAQWYALGCPGSEDLCDSYNAMVLRFWVWDRERFRKRRLPPPPVSSND